MSDPTVRTPQTSQEKLRLTRPSQWAQPLPESSGWGALNTLISGIVLFGFLGWLAGRLLGAPWIAMIGLLAGMGAALTVIWFRYGTGRVETSQSAHTVDSAAPEVRTDNLKEHR